MNRRGVVSGWRKAHNRKKQEKEEYMGFRVAVPSIDAGKMKKQKKIPR